MIEFSTVSKVFPGGTRAVDDFSLVIPSRKTTVFVGSSGCGKTTLLRMINRMVEPSAGAISIDGDDIAGQSPVQLRRRIGYVMQNSGLLPHFTVAENIATVPVLQGENRKKARTRALELMETVGLDIAMANRYPSQLSGGQQQRVGVARALAADPPVMLMDEPFGATDPITRERLQAEFLRLQESIGKTIIFVTHDFDEAIRLGDRIAVLSERSRIEQFDTPAAILAAPANDYVRSFIGHGAALKRLALIPVADAPLGPVTDAGAVPVSITDNLRDALDLLVLNGSPAVTVVDRDGRPVGSLTMERISAALGVEVGGLSTHPGGER